MIDHMEREAQGENSDLVYMVTSWIHTVNNMTQNFTNLTKSDQTWLRTELKQSLIDDDMNI